jgi:uncharacterized membrane protein
MWITVSLILFYLFSPVLIIYLCNISNFLNRLGAVVLAYVIGLLIGNTGIIPAASPGFTELLGERMVIPDDELLQYMVSGQITETDLVVNQIASVQNIVITVAILLAIPLLLFSLDLRRWFKFAKGAALSLVLALVSLLIAIVSGNFMIGRSIEESWKISGMLIGVYTGGTANLAAIGTALKVNPDIFILTHTYDLIIGAVTLLFLMTIAQRLFNSFLPRFKDVHRPPMMKQVSAEYSHFENYGNLVKREQMPNILKSLGLAILILGIAGGFSLILPESAREVTVILSITTLGLLASLIKSINRMNISFELGMYLILIFSLGVSSMANLREMFQIEFLQLFLFVLWVIFGSIFIHVILAKIFKVDADTTIITITALTYSPPFVPAVAGALKNRDVIISGITIGILGFAFGTYLGIFMAALLK